MPTIMAASTSPPVTHPVATMLARGNAVDFGLTSSQFTLSDDFGSSNTTDAVTAVVDLGAAS